MSEFEEKFGNRFFIIDSKNINEINSKLYGFTIIDNEIVNEGSFIDESSLNGMGAYIYINSSNDSISISQDFNGCWGLYLYQEDGYFALSNSFLKLVEFLKDNHEISFNKEYADAFLYSYLCSFAYKETLINEIQLLPRHSKVIIDKLNSTLTVEKIDYGLHSINVDSKKGLDALDKWYYKWVDIIRSIKSKTNNLSIDLSGGFDSRVVAALWLNANIDLNKVRIKSHTNKLHSHSEDYIIASKISDEFDFKLNHSSFSFY